MAGLVSSGLSNRDIADSLVLSRYTVQSHISHILAKLGVRPRTDVARLVTHDGVMVHRGVIAA